MRAKIQQLSIIALTMVLYFCSQNFMVICAVLEIEMHGNRVLDLIFVMFWSHALTHPSGGLRIIICEPSKFESRFLAASFLSTS